MLKYKRVLLKVSGEALSDGKSGISGEKLNVLANQIKDAVNLGVSIGIVVGGGNLWRGRQNTNITRGTADYIGILATVMNSLALGDTLSSIGVPNKVVTSFFMDKIAESFFLPNVLEYLEQGKVVIFGGGTGSPYFSTDTTAALRACEISAEAVLCAKSIDGVYDSDPGINKDAKKFKQLTYKEVLDRELKALDLTATALCREHSLPIVVFSKDNENCIVDAVCGKNIGTTIQ